MKQARQIAKITKGIANHRRVEILYLIDKNPGLSVLETNSILKTNYKTISEHLKKLEQSGLIYKYNQGAAILHELSPLGKHVLEFLRTLE